MNRWESPSARKKRLREEKIKLVVQLRGEQHLSFSQIGAQIGRSEQWCSRAYLRHKCNRVKEAPNVIV